MKNFFNKFGGYFGVCIILLVAGFICLGIANWIDFMVWPAYVFLGLLTILTVCGIVYVLLVRPIINFFKDE